MNAVPQTRGVNTDTGDKREGSGNIGVEDAMEEGE